MPAATRLHKNNLPSLFDFDRFEAEGLYLPSATHVPELTRVVLAVDSEENNVATATPPADLKYRLDNARNVVRALQALEDKRAGRTVKGNTNAILRDFWHVYDPEISCRLFGRLDLGAEWNSVRAELRTYVDSFDLFQKRITASPFVPVRIVNLAWKIVEKLGFGGGLVLDASRIPGLFICENHTATQNSVVRTVSDEPLATAMLALMNPGWDVVSTDIPSIGLGQRYDLIFAAPGSSRRAVTTTEPAGKLGLPLQDYSVVKFLTALKPGAIGVFAVPYDVMDRTEAKARMYAADLANLIAAYRIPAGPENSLGYDLLFFRKLGDENIASTKWIESRKTQTRDGYDANVNEYFVTNPDHVLGEHVKPNLGNSRTYGCKQMYSRKPEDLLADLVQSLTIEITNADDLRFVQSTTDLASWTGARENNYVLDSRDRLCQVEERVLRPLLIRSQHGRGLDRRSVGVIRAFVPLRDALREVLRLQSEDKDSSRAQRRLRETYDAFVDEFGPINVTRKVMVTNPVTKAENEIIRRPNIEPLTQDPSCYLVSSIEEYDEETKVATRGPVFTGRVIRRPVPKNISTPTEALVACLQERSHVDIDRIAELAGLDVTATVAALGDRIFPVPSLHGKTQYETSDEYLSGKVRAKLKLAKAAHAITGKLEANINALEATIPTDLGPGDITARLGTPWIPTDDITKFVEDRMNISTTIAHESAIASWTVDGVPFIGRPQSTSEWGTGRRNAGLLLEDALNARIPAIYDTYYDVDGKQRKKLNPVDTEAAKDKMASIKTAFEEWIWKDVDRATRLVRFYNENYNDIVPRWFNGDHLEVEGLNATIELYDTQKRAIWRILSSGDTYINHAVGSGKTRIMATAVQMQQKLGLITKPMIVVPGHCLAQFSREYFQAFPTANILVADENNFSERNRRRFLATATTGQWDAIVISHSAFLLIAPPKGFEDSILDDYRHEIERLIEKNKGPEHAKTRQRLVNRQRMFINQVQRLCSNRDCAFTIEDLGVDQIIVDEAQSFRKLSFSTNSENLKGVDPDGSKKSWDLYVKSRYVATKNPGRSLIMASGTAITNTLAELYSIGRFMDPDTLRERNLHEFDAWAASFGQTVTELELQPNGFYKPVTRFSQFVNIPELVAMYRLKADVVMKEDLKAFVDLPKVATGKRQIRTSERSPAFRHYQKILDGRIDAIKGRSRARKGNDILLSVIGDGRHAAIDMRLVDKNAADETTNKLNDLINNVHRIWHDTRDNVYSNGGVPGATQMIFSDLGTFGVEKTRGFSAYGWMEHRFAALGIPENEVRFVQRCRNSAEKQALFNDFNAGKVRILVGSSETMGTGVNAQRRLIALHHLDVPWLPSQIEQREGRIERKGNENPEISIFAYATVGSYDATGWQVVERKQKFIEMAFRGDSSVRKVEDVSSEANQFAMAKAIASGDQRLMQKAGLETEIQRLQRKRSAHYDDQHRVRVTIHQAKAALVSVRKLQAEIAVDLTKRIMTSADAFHAVIDGKNYYERTKANTALLLAVERNAVDTKNSGTYEATAEIGSIGGFPITTSFRQRSADFVFGRRIVSLEFVHNTADIDIVTTDDTGYGIITRLERRIQKLGTEIDEHRDREKQLETMIAEYEARSESPFELQDELDEKREQLDQINKELKTESDLHDKALEDEAIKAAAKALAQSV